MRIVITGPGGVIPMASGELLPPNMAQEAVNAKLYSGEIRPFGGLRRIWKKPSSLVSIGALSRFKSTPVVDLKGAVTAITAANPAVIHTTSTTGLSTGNTVYISGINNYSHPLNDVAYTITVINGTQFSLNSVNGTGMAAVTSPGYWTKSGGYFFMHSVHASFVRGPVKGDTAERTYYTIANGAPRMTYDPLALTGGGDNYPKDYHTLGVPAPTSFTGVTKVFNTGTVDTAYQEDPVVINTDEDHNMVTGDFVTFSGLVGDLAPYNGDYFSIVYLGPRSFSLRTLDGTTNKALAGPLYVGGGAWSQAHGQEPDECPYELFQNVQYVYTFVSASGEESPPSPPIAVEIGPHEKARIAISSLSTGPAGDYDIDARRIYRLVSGADSDDFFFVGEIPTSTTTGYFYDGVNNVADELLPSELWDVPPTDLHSLILLPNGVLAGVSKNRLCFSESNVPHAWNPFYQQVANYDFVGCGNFGTTVVPVTHEDAYLANGATPDIVTLEALKTGQGCVSERGIVSIGRYGVLYPSPDGLVSVTPSGWDIATKNYFTHDEWQALKPSSIHAYLYDGRYIAFYNNGVDQGGFIFDPTNIQHGLIFIDFYASAGYYDPTSDSLLLVDGTHVVRWDDTDLPPLTYRWRSKRYDTVDRITYTCAEVYASTYDDLTLRVFADDSMVAEKVITSEEPIRLPRYTPARNHYVEVEGTDNIKRIAIAEAFEELT